MAALQEKKSCGQRMEEFRHYCWNPDTGQLLGRTLSRWATKPPKQAGTMLRSTEAEQGPQAPSQGSAFSQGTGAGWHVARRQAQHTVWISLYYVGFYVVMTGLFALSLYTLMSTIDPYTPDFQDQLKSPGVTLRPDVYGEKGLEISYNVSDNRTWAGLVHTLHTFLEGYSPAAQENSVNCTSETYYFQERFEAPNHTKFSCQFTAQMLHNCSGLLDPDFGFREGKPCFIIKMNRIVKFLPSNGTAPRVDCAFRDKPHQDAAPLQVEYYPHGGTYSLHYFPYYGRRAQPHYSNPLVAAKLLNVPRNADVVIVCKVLADHVTSNNPHDPYEGKVEFKLRIQQ